VKYKNQEVILRLLINEGPLTRADLAKKMRSTKPTISKNVEDMISSGKVIEIGKDDNAIGKKGILLDVNESYGYVLVIDLSKNQFKAVLSNLKEEWIDTCKVSFEQYIVGGEPRYVDVITKLKIFLKKHQEITDGLVSSVISISGVVGHNDELYLTNLKYKQTALNQLIPFIKEELKLPVSIKNNVNLAVLAAQKYSAYNESDNLYLLSCDIGVGAGIIINQQLYEGDRFAAGEVGFILPVQSKDGQFLTLEEKVSLHALAARYRSITDDRQKYEDLIDAVNAGHEGALEIYEDVLNDLSITITNIGSILDIRTILVVGRLFNLKETMIEDLNDKIEKMTPFETVVVPTAIKDMSLRGATIIGVEKVVSEMVKKHIKRER
jgi:predicted NBD/HSP70 family sugar kinase